MSKISDAFFLRLTFSRQLGITVALGIFMLALCSSIAGSWQDNERARSNLLEQGLRITENLARQSTLALIYASADNAAVAADATLLFPGVVSLEIFDTNGRVLLSRGNAAGFFERTTHTHDKTAAFLDAESPGAWRFSAPVYSHPSASPFYDEIAPELLGHVTVVLSKEALSQAITGIFVANLITSFSFALLFLFLIRLLTRRMTQPLNQLSACMRRAEAGELQVRAGHEGPQDIAYMAHAFNSMMSVLEEHAAKNRQLNIELEQRVLQRTAQLEASNKELEEFSYSMSHDMRTPLRALDGFSKILLDEHGEKLDEEGKRLVKVLRDNAQRMGRLIDDILHYLSMGRRKMQFASVEIDRIAAEVFTQLQAKYPERRLRFEIGALPPAFGDHEMLREAIQNLMENAVKFSMPDGEVYIEVKGLADAGGNTYSVTDHGIGFDMRYVDKLFRVFERVHATGQYEGSGIGLALVKRIVTRHGGRVWAEGRVDEGVTIHFFLPTGRLESVG
jgi:signal transduction histidine kinase